jgi:hypothetical protein
MHTMNDVVFGIHDRVINIIDKISEKCNIQGWNNTVALVAESREEMGDMHE